MFAPRAGFTSIRWHARFRPIRVRASSLFCDRATSIISVSKQLFRSPTGSSGQFDTPWGRIELVHTDRPVTMESGIVFERGRLAEATPARAWSDLKRVGRNVDLVDPDFMHASATAGAGR